MISSQARIKQRSVGRAATLSRRCGEALRFWTDQPKVANGKWSRELARECARADLVPHARHIPRPTLLAREIHRSFADDNPPTGWIRPCA